MNQNPNKIRKKTDSALVDRIVENDKERKRESVKKMEEKRKRVFFLIFFRSGQRAVVWDLGWGQLCEIGRWMGVLESFSLLGV